MQRILLTIVGLALLSGSIRAQETFPRNGVRDDRQHAYAFINATIHTDYQTVVENATLLIREGKIVLAGAGITIPSGYVQIDLEGKHIYPSFVDPYTHYGLDPVVVKPPTFFGRREQIEPKSKQAYNANEAIKAAYHASEKFKVKDSDADKMRSMGFGTVLTFRPDGIARGTGAVVTLRNSSANNVILLPQATANFSFNKGTSPQDFPFSLMGSQALLRQTYMDAAWYDKLSPKPFTDQGLEGLIATQNLPQVFETTNWKNVLRADNVGDEFNIQYVFKGSGDEYQRINEIKNTGATFIIPVSFPKAVDVEDPWDAHKATLNEMKHWEMAPANLSYLDEAGVRFAITSNGAGTDFHKNLMKAIQHGASKQAVLKALTVTPAEILNIQDRVGTLTSGKLANFIITSDELFTEGAQIHENWIQGNRYELKPLVSPDYSGKYNLTVGNGVSYALEISGKPGSQKAEIKINDSTAVKVTSEFTMDLVNLSFDLPSDSTNVRLSGWRSGQDLAGKGSLENGEWANWSAVYQQAMEEEEEEEKPEAAQIVPEIGNVIYPFVAHGREVVPQQEDILITNATVWTNEDDGILEDTDILIKDGKISRIGKDLKASGARVIDAQGRHVTPGIIDEHSHIALDGVNDLATNSGMVRMYDVVDSEDINIYRQLSGGVTAAQLLHGSANPVGGQSALIKFRWGKSPGEMKIEGADGFIKFALGENVKRSRLPTSIRYPLTRMGVEQVFVDAFTNARTYEKQWMAYDGMSSKDKVSVNAPRRDLVHETMLEIINKERFISCHSYVQSEINMLMKVADNFGFNVNTFTHILEGYKVADKMAEHGAGGSTFSDWWAYKWEVRYAIPYNPVLMMEAGVTVAINSDDGEMARRLNQEAAKSVKYGDMDEQDALKMVTLNPAKLLHLDDQMGSIKVGKDADVVVWTDHPLSIYAKSSYTIVDGTIYFDLEEDEKMRESIKAERARLIRKLLAEKKGGAPTGKPMGGRRVQLHCDDLVGFDRFEQEVR